jgi:genome maintenance exonuclease 1
VWKDKPAIIDFKQSNKAKKREWIDDYFLQLCAYMLAHDEVHETKIEAGVILMCTQDFQYQEFVLEGSDLEKYKNMWWDRVAEYYKNKQ